MKTAEEIIQEYLDRGYSPESLRILAGSRDEPLGSQMLAALDAREREVAAAGEAVAPEEFVPEAEMTFCVADDADAAAWDAAEEIIDFDVMAETAGGAVLEETTDEIVEEIAEEVVEEVAAEVPAELEETVAEVFIEQAADQAGEPASSDYIPEATAEEKKESKESRREKRRRSRQEKKEEKKKAKRAQKMEREEEELPEIVLYPLAMSNAEVVEAPVMSEAMSILTPVDIIGAMEECDPLVAPETLAALSLHSYAFAESILAMAQTELEVATNNNTLQLIEQNNAEAELENFTEEEFAAEAEVAEAPEHPECPEHNVILFRMPETEDFEEGEEDDEEDYAPVLHILSAPEPDPEADTALVSSCDVTENAVEQLLTEEVAEEAVEEVAEETPEPQNVLELQLERGRALELEAKLEQETSLRAALEEDYQARLDSFAARILDAQTAIAASETRVAEKNAELDARTAILEETRARLAEQEAKRNELLQKLEAADAALQAKDGEFSRAAEEHGGLRDEHTRLFNEFEDLRKAYNEIVTDVIPGLQTERDDLAMTVERQCAKEQTLRTSLASSRKRLAAGYVLGAAASFMLVMLPIANWLRSGDDSRQLAVDHQLFSELRETLDTQVQQNVDAQTRIVELERKITRARDEIAKLDGQNKELASLATTQHAPQYAEDIAVFKPEAASTSGTPTRAMTMALQATVPPGGKLHVNEVMDPAGSIEQLAMANRERGLDARPEAQMARATTTDGKPLAISAVARTDGGYLRPKANAKADGAAATKITLRAADSKELAGAAAPADTVTAKVKKGEGVAQVVYRVLNTRDPEVIAWVIDQNKIRNDRRGNPLIQPNQELRLPKSGNIGQSASAAGKNR